MSIKSRIVMFYITVIIIPSILLISLNWMFVNSVRSKFNDEVEQIMISNNVQRNQEMADNITALVTNLSEDGSLTKEDLDTLDIVFNGMFKIPIKIEAENGVVFVSKWEDINGNDAGKLLVENTVKVNNEVIEFGFSDQSLRKKPRQIEFFHKYSNISLGIITGAFILLSLVFIQIVSRYYYRPLKKIEKKVNDIRSGRESEPLEINRKDEFGDVFSAINHMEYELEKSNAMQVKYELNRNELIANISHDLKTPITAIRGYVDGIHDGVANTPEKLDRYVTIIRGYVKDISNLIDDLTTISNLDIDVSTFAFEEVDICNYMEDFSEELRFDLDEKGILLEVENEVKGSCLVMLDRDKIKRVLSNLISNAVKFLNKEEKYIRIKLCESSDYISVSITDNGIGIPTERLEDIFERFYKVDQSRNSEFGGNGLGLSIAKQIIDKHSGSIWTESVEGEQTTVTFTLRKVKL